MKADKAPKQSHPTSDHESESARILKRIGQESELGRRSAQPEENDWIEIWGTRIGRGIALAFMAAGIVTIIRYLTS